MPLRPLKDKEIKKLKEKIKQLKKKKKIKNRRGNRQGVNVNQRVIINNSDSQSKVHRAPPSVFPVLQQHIPSNPTSYDHTLLKRLTDLENRNPLTRDVYSRHHHQINRFADQTDQLGIGINNDSLSASRSGFIKDEENMSQLTDIATANDEDIATINDEQSLYVLKPPPEKEVNLDEHNLEKETPPDINPPKKQGRGRNKTDEERRIKFEEDERKRIERREKAAEMKAQREATKSFNKQLKSFL